MQMDCSDLSDTSGIPVNAISLRVENEQRSRAGKKKSQEKKKQCASLFGHYSKV